MSGDVPAEDDYRGLVGSGIEKAYGLESVDRLHGCPSCSVTWFGPENRCWVCDATTEGPVEVVPPN